MSATKQVIKTLFAKQDDRSYLSRNGQWRIVRENNLTPRNELSRGRVYGRSGWCVYDLGEEDPGLWGFWGRFYNNRGIDDRHYYPFRTLKDAVEELGWQVGLESLGATEADMVESEVQS